MRELLSFGLGAPEVCKNSRGYVMAKVWSNVPGSAPRSQRYDLGRRAIETDDPDLIVGDVRNKVAKDDWQHVIGFTVLKFCGAPKHIATRFERFSSFAFTKPGTPEYKLDGNLRPYPDGDGVCEATIRYEGANIGVLYHVVDFPTTAYEYATERELTIVQAAAKQDVSGLAHSTNVVLRPSVVRIEGLPGAA